MINEKYKLIENVNPYTPYTPVIKHGWKIQHGELPLKAPIQGFQECCLSSSLLAASYLTCPGKATGTDSPEPSLAPTKVHPQIMAL